MSQVSARSPMPKLSVVRYGRKAEALKVTPDSTMNQSIDPLTQPASLDLKKLNQKFENSNPKDTLAWCVINIPTGLVQVSAFNVDDMLITDLLYRELKPTYPVPVMFLDTLHHFPETLELVAKAKHIYNLNLKIYKIPDVGTRESFATKYGDSLWDKDIDQFSQLTKIEPLQRGWLNWGRSPGSQADDEIRQIADPIWPFLS